MGHQRADKGLGNPPLRCIQQPVVVRDRDGRPQENSLVVHCCVCRAVMHCLDISSGYAGPWNVIFSLSYLILGFS